MKFKPGDEVFIRAEVTDISPGSERPYFVAPDKYSVNWVSEDKIIPADKTYADGLNDAWELVRKLEEIEQDERKKMFSYCSVRAIIEDCTIEEVMDKIEAYEKENFKVGDVVYYSDGEYESAKSIVTRVQGKTVYTVYSDGSCGQEHNPSDLKKTGKHIDVESLLRQIGE